MTLHLTPVLEQQLEHLAAQTQTSPSELVQEILNRYVQNLETLSAEVRQAEEDADRSGWLSSEDVWQRMEERLRKTA